MKIKLILLLMICSIGGVSQNEIPYLNELYKPVPIHFIKIDVLKSAVCQLHFDYEFYNGKRFGEEIGCSVFYPDRVISFINEEPGDFGWFDRTAGHYRGYGVEFTEKLYFPKKHCNPYIGIVISHKYKH